MKVEEYVGANQASAIFARYLPDIMTDNSKIQVVTADMGMAADLTRFSLLYPENYEDVGIAEQNLIGVCEGLASEGFKSIATAQASFLSMRAFEMDRQYLGYMHSPVILVALNSGFLLQYMGNTHFAIEDLAIMRTIPGMTVISPADAGEAVAAFDAVLKYDGPVYIRLTGLASAKPVYECECNFEIGKDIILREGKDLVLFSTGSMVAYTLQAAEILSSQYCIDAKVVDVSTLKPLDEETLRKSKNAKLFVSIEEHSVIGGLGSAISDFIATEIGFPSLLKLGIQDKFSVLGDYDYLVKQHRLTPELIAEDINNKYKVL